MFSDFSNEFVERAEECRIEARHATHEEERAEWLALAEEWARLARVSATAAEPLEKELKREAA
jgi:hypothetical protein